MTLLIVVVAIRSWTQLGFVTYLPFYCLNYLKTGPEQVASFLFVFLFGGVVGTLIGGPIADRWGVRRQIIGAFLISVPLGTLFLLSHGVVSYIVLALFGAVLISTFTTSVVLGQAYLPRNPGMASGMTVGLAVGSGGVAVILFGGIADKFGVPTVLWICAVLPLMALIASSFLPAITQKKRLTVNR
jgi:FSR family fosmidomycin resistance protein-like MFS transporter